jgi:spoIIIJ-associated protein
MTTIDKTGTSIEELIQQFRAENNIRDWELKYDIIKKPSAGFLGMFSSKIAIVRFQLPDLQDRVALFTDKLLHQMGVGFEKIDCRLEGKTVYLEVVDCKDPGFFIGKNGSMVETIQFFINRVFENDRRIDRIYLDASGYRQRRESTFIRQFLPLFNKVKTSGKPLTMEPMTAADRRIVHRHIEGDNSLRTLTIGEGEMKRIVVFSSKQKESDVLPLVQGQVKQSPRPRKPLPAKPDTAPGEEKETAKPQQRPRRQSRPKPPQDKELTPRPSTDDNNPPARRPQRRRPPRDKAPQKDS